MYDNDAGEITRPDIPAALGSSPGDGDLRSSGFHPRQERELSPYMAMPVLPSRLNEPTVPDAALKVSMARAAVPEEHTPSDVGRVPRSNPRHELPPTASPDRTSTVPPPARARAKTSLPPDSARAKKSAPPDSAGFRVTAKATPAALREPEHPSLLRAFLLVTATAVAAAMIGVGLGNGSIERWFAPSEPVAAPGPALSVARVAPARAVPPVTPPSVAPPRAAVDDAPRVPVMRVDQLPPGEASATPEPKASAKPAPKPAHRGSRR